MVGSITSTRPAKIISVYGELDRTVYGLPKKSEVEEIHQRASGNYSSEVIRKIIAALTKLDEIIEPYRIPNPTKRVVDNNKYHRAVEKVSNLLNQIPMSASGVYRTAFEDYSSEAIELSAKVPKAKKPKRTRTQKAVLEEKVSAQESISVPVMFEATGEVSVSEAISG